MINSIKILLIEPPFYRLYNDQFSLNKYPLSLGYLASSIKKNTDWNVWVYNADFYHSSLNYTFAYLASEGYKNYLKNINTFSYSVWKEVKSTILEYHPTVVGITCKSQNYISALHTAKICKEINHDCIVILGGPHVTFAGKEVMSQREFDFAIKGEGENTIIELLSHINDKLEYKKIDGLIYREGNDINENKQRPLIQNIDSIPSPYIYVKEVLKDFNRYPRHAFRNIFSIRGCPYNCTFCGSGKIWQHKVRFRSIENIIEEINLLRTFSINYFNFDDDTFGVTKKRIRDLCTEIINHHCEIKWSCEMHVKLIDDEIVSIMKKAGCDLIKIGIESGNNTILKDIGKNITIEDAISACKIIRKARIHLMAFFMIGFPQETLETMKDTIRAIKHTPGFITYSIFTPYIGTAAYDFCKKNKLIPDHFNVSLYNHQSPSNCFCLYISHDQFRKNAVKIEKMVDRKNKIQKMKLFSQKFNFINLFKKLIS